MKKWTLLLVLTIFISSILSLELFKVEHVNHCCSGDDCPVCALINASEENNLSDGIDFASDSVCIFSFVIFSLITLSVISFLKSTPVTLKDKLLN